MRAPRLAAAVFLACLASAAAQACEVTEVDGPAVMSAGDTRQPLSVGTDVLVGQVIQTGPDARVTLICDGGLSVAIAPESRLRIDRALGGAATGWARFFRRGGQMGLIEGAAGFLMRDFGGSRFRVKTPNAVAAVRSTQWAMETTAESSAVFVREGRVRVTGGGTSQGLDPGDGIDIEPGGSSGVRDWGAQRIAALNERIGGAWR